MSREDKIQNIQKKLSSLDVEGWLLYDFHRKNDLAWKFLELMEDKVATRRFFYWIPKEGEPVKITHEIEPDLLKFWPGKTLTYRSYEEMKYHLSTLLPEGKKIAMEYYEGGKNPYLSKVDGGTIDLVRSFGLEIVSSKDLLFDSISRFTSYQTDSHIESAKFLDHTMLEAWNYVKEMVEEKRPITEYDLQQKILHDFTIGGYVSSSKPICAVKEHTADVHYSPTKEGAYLIEKGDLLLIDMWAKKDHHMAVYADITRMAYVGKEPKSSYKEVFSIVRKAQKETLAFIKNSFQEGKSLRGSEVDRYCRRIIEEAGYGSYFIHETGHSIDRECHGSGTWLDSLEVIDDRYLQKGSCFSIEPGIYLPGKFGIRLEHDVLIHEDGRVEGTGGFQDEIFSLF